MQTYPLVDHREDGPWTPSYELMGTCTLCGERHIALFNKGEKPNAYDHDCPHCEVTGMLVYGHTKYARELRLENAKAAAQARAPKALPPGWGILDNPGGM